MKHLSAMFKGSFLLAAVLSLLFIPSSVAEDSFFDSDGVKIHYIVEGKGEPLLLLHGFGGSIQQMSDAIKDLSNNFQVIAMDCRGHGQSEKPHDPDAYGMNMVEDYIRLLDHLNIKKAHVSGYSMGGAIALGIVGFHPERVLSATVGGAGWIPPGQERKFAEANWDDRAESLEQGKGLGPEWLNATQDERLALAAVLRNFAPSPTETQIRSNKIPVLALIGEEDPLKKDVDRLNGLMPNLKIVVIPNADHGEAARDPLGIKSLNDFLLEHSSSKSGK